MSVVTIPNRREVMFLISTNPVVATIDLGGGDSLPVTFVEQTMLDLYRRHKAGKDVPGVGFSRATMKEGTRLGRWLEKHGRFTSGYNATTGESNRSTKSKDDHLQAARDVLYVHADQIIDMITDKVKAALAAKKREEEKRNAARREAAQNAAPISPTRTAEILAMVGGKLPEDAEPLTERNPVPVRRTA